MRNNLRKISAIIIFIFLQRALWLYSVEHLSLRPQAVAEKNKERVQPSVVELGNFKHVLVTAGNAKGDKIEEQTRSLLNNIDAQLESCGADRDQVARMTVYLEDISQKDACKNILGNYFGKLPATDFVQQPPLSGGLLSIQLLAISGEDVEVKRRSEYMTIARTGNMRWAYLGGVAPNPALTDTYEQAHDCFLRMKALLEGEGFKYENVLRTWLYQRDIYGKDPDGQERYNKLNLARRHVYTQGGEEGQPIKFGNGFVLIDLDGNVITTPITVPPASTGIGMQAWPFVMGAIALLPTEGVTLQFLENPKQVSAFAYRPGAQHGMVGETAPMFSRGIAVLFGEYKIIYASGTASIIGLVTVHIDDVARQTQTTLDNVDLVFNQAGASLKDAAQITVYVKNPEDFDVVEKEVQKRCKGIPCVYVIADVCRENLLVEIEAMGFVRVPSQGSIGTIKPEEATLVSSILRPRAAIDRPLDQSQTPQKVVWIDVKFSACPYIQRTIDQYRMAMSIIEENWQEEKRLERIKEVERNLTFLQPDSSLDKFELQARLYQLMELLSESLTIIKQSGNWVRYESGKIHETPKFLRLWGNVLLVEAQASLLLTRLENGPNIEEVEKENIEKIATSLRTSTQSLNDALLSIKRWRSHEQNYVQGLLFPYDEASLKPVREKLNSAGLKASRSLVSPAPQDQNGRNFKTGVNVFIKDLVDTQASRWANLFFSVDIDYEYGDRGRPLIRKEKPFSYAFSWVGPVPPEKLDAEVKKRISNEIAKTGQVYVNFLGASIDPTDGRIRIMGYDVDNSVLRVRQETGQLSNNPVVYMDIAVVKGPLIESDREELLDVIKNYQLYEFGAFAATDVYDVRHSPELMLRDAEVVLTPDMHPSPTLNLQLAKEIILQVRERCSGLGNCEMYSTHLARRLFEEGIEVQIKKGNEHWWVEEVSPYGCVLDAYPAGLGIVGISFARDLGDDRFIILKKGSEAVEKVYKGEIDEDLTKQAKEAANSEKFYDEETKRLIVLAEHGVQYSEGKYFNQEKVIAGFRRQLEFARKKLEEIQMRNWRNLQTYALSAVLRPQAVGEKEKTTVSSWRKDVRLF